MLNGQQFPINEKENEKGQLRRGIEKRKKNGLNVKIRLILILAIELKIVTLRFQMTNLLKAILRINANNSCAVEYPVASDKLLRDFIFIYLLKKTPVLTHPK